MMGIILGKKLDMIASFVGSFVMFGGGNVITIMCSILHFHFRLH